MIPLIPSVSFFLTHFLLLIRRRRFAEINLLVLFLGIVTVAYLSRYNKIDQIKYHQMIVPEAPASVLANRQILVLDDQPELFLNNRLATSFYEWELCRPLFEQPDYYEHVVQVNRAFATELPEVIVDPENLMKGFLDRIPALEVKYEKSPEGYRLKKETKAISN
jgi:hypothetical protein